MLQRILVASWVAVALLGSMPLAATAAAPPTASASTIPPTIVTVTVAAGVSPQLVARILDEADAIWRPIGVTFIWQRASHVAVPYARGSETGQDAPKTLHLIILDNRVDGREGRLPLGWIALDDAKAPGQAIYLSHANALQTMADARGVVGTLGDMPPIISRELLLGRAMGRVLAHELGHYLLASKIHTVRGLMKAVLSVDELFMPNLGFRIEPEQRRDVAARLQGEPLAVAGSSGDLQGR